MTGLEEKTGIDTEALPPEPTQGTERRQLKTHEIHANTMGTMTRKNPKQR